MKEQMLNKIYEQLKINLKDLELSISHDEKELKEMRQNSQSSEIEEQAQSLDMESNLISLLNKKYSRVMHLKSALTKIANKEDFGKCSGCDISISEKRLLANPSVLLCLDCQEDFEKNI